MNVAQRLRRGVTANIFAHAVTLVIQIASVPILLWAWGGAGMGEWLLVSSVPAQLVAGDLGLPAVAANLMVMAVVADDRAEARRVLQTTLVSLVALGPLLLLPLLLLAMALPLADWFGLTLLDGPSLDLTLALLVARMWLILLSGGLINAFRCDGHYAAGTYLSNFFRLVEFIGMALVLFAGGGMVAAAASMVVAQGAGLLALAIGLRRRSPWLVIGWREARLATLRRMIRPALSFLVFPIVNACNQQAPLMVAGLLLGPQATTALATGRTLARMAQQANSIIGAALWPEMSRAFGEGTVARMRTLNRGAVKAVFWAGLLSMAGLWLFGPDIYRIWTGNRFALDQTMFLLLLAMNLINGVWSMSLVVQTASNRHDRAAGIMLATCLFSVAACYAGAAGAGLAGIAASLLLCELLIALPVMRDSLRHTQDTASAFLADMANPAGLYHLWRGRGG